MKKTMMVAQKLYEGVSINGNHEGLITYMRTDSVNLSQTALAQAKEVITAQFGKEYALDTPRLYKGEEKVLKKLMRQFVLPIFLELRRVLKIFRQRSIQTL